MCQFGSLGGVFELYVCVVFLVVVSNEQKKNTTQNLKDEFQNEFKDSHTPAPVCTGECGNKLGQMIADIQSQEVTVFFFCMFLIFLECNLIQT